MVRIPYPKHSKPIYQCEKQKKNFLTKPAVAKKYKKARWKIFIYYHVLSGQKKISIKEL